MVPVIGNVSRLMTRQCYILIESKYSWDSFLKFDSSHLFLQEFVFWCTNLFNPNNRVLNFYSKRHPIVCSDASSLAAGAICFFDNEDQYSHSNFSKFECAETTWRELKAIEEALKSFKDQMSSKSVRILTDCQVKI